MLLCMLATAATLQGTVYDENLLPAEGALVTIDTTPTQRMLARDGMYSFEVPPGEYTLTTTLDDLEVSENVTISQNGTFSFDLFVFFNVENDLGDLTEELEEPVLDLPQEGNNPWAVVALLTVVLFVLVGPPLFLYRHYRKLHAHTPADELLRLLRKEGGRMTQKELRTHLPMSEAKISLLVAELEAMGKLQKIKKGRGNILVLK